MNNLAIFASGSGTNAEAIMNFFESHPEKGAIKVVISNNKDAYVLQRARNHGVAEVVFSKSDFYNNPSIILNTLKERDVNWIILAGFMLLVHNDIIYAYKNHIINIHPALLPKFGGRGMYGHHVHEAVVDAGEAKTGITIHYVNEHYDQGAVIFQAETDLDPSDTADVVAEKIHVLEQKYFPQIISETINDYK